MVISYSSRRKGVQCAEGSLSQEETWLYSEIYMG